MDIRSIQTHIHIPAVRPMSMRAMPVAAPVAAPAVAGTAVQSLRGWLKEYSSGSGNLFERVVADPSGQGTMFRRGLMAAEVVTLDV